MSATLQGRPASPGLSLAPAFVVAPRDPRDVEQGPAGPPEQEWERARQALVRTGEDLTTLAERVTDDAGAEEAAIFFAHAEFAADPELHDRIRAAIQGGAGAQKAVAEGFDGFRDLLAASSSEYLAARAADLDDVRDQVLDVLSGATQAAVPTSRCVIVAKEVTPSQTARLPHQLIAGIACQSGSPTSHAAILARSLGIPAVVGVTGLLDAVAADVVVAVDGDGGTVAVAPSEDERQELRRRIELAETHRQELESLRDVEGVTADGHRVELAANINGPEAIDAAVAAGAEGCGLVRTEFLFLESQTAPTVDEQEAFYRRALEAFPGRRVVLRTMDIGADKPLPFVDRDPEENPALGVRGLRLGFAMPELLRDQLRALARAASGGDQAGRMAVMFPMVSRPDEVARVRELFTQAAQDEGADLSDVEVGIMIEVPAAALAARRFAPHVDFFSVGTNDLLQYLFAADRLQADVADLPDLCDPDVLRLLADVADAAHEAGRWIGVCGEAAANPLSAAALVGAGFDELSMTPRAIPVVKDMLRQARRDELREAVRNAIQAPDAAEARTLIAKAAGL